ncbi:MAG: heavy metal-binding domain-containing protein [Ignavibacteriaceae bacterium]|jgi:hypothetical protein
MLLNNSKLLSIVLGVILLSSVGLFAQNKCSCCSDKDDISKIRVEDASAMQDSTHSKDKHKGHMHSSTNEKKSSIVHEGTIDLTEIDENGDGKVYQDQMCWNVVSDEAGQCSQCGMKLKEVSLEEAKKNLEDNGYKTK